MQNSKEICYLGENSDMAYSEMITHIFENSIAPSQTGDYLFENSKKNEFDSKGAKLN